MEKKLDAEQIRVTEKNILSFIFGKDHYIEDEYTHKIHHEIFETLMTDYGKAISMDDIDCVLDSLIGSKYIYRFKTEDNKYELSLAPNGQDYAFENNYITLQDLNKKLIAVNVKNLDFPMLNLRLS